MDCGVVLNRFDHRRSCLWSIGRCVRPPPSDVRCSCSLQRGIGAVRGIPNDRAVDVCTTSTGPWRWRPHDAIASSGWRSHTASSTGSISRLSGRGRRLCEYVRAYCGRLSDRTLRMAVDLPDQRSNRDCCRAANSGASKQGARKIGLAARSRRAAFFHHIRGRDPACQSAGSVAELAETSGPCLRSAAC